MNRITAFKLLSNGKKGFEITGTDCTVADESNRFLHQDAIIRTRKFPIPTGIRAKVKSLAYPFLVYTDYWRSEYQPLMFHGHTAPNPDLLTDDNESDITKLINIWNRVKINGCSSSGDNIIIDGEVVFGGFSLKGKIVVSKEDDHALYSFVEESFISILEMLSSLISKPKLDFSPNEISEVMESMNSNIDPDSDDDALLQMLKGAEQKGFGIVLDDNLLTQLAEHSENEVSKSVEDSKDANSESDSKIIEKTSEEVIEPESMDSEIASVTTKSEDLFEPGESVE